MFNHGTIFYGSQDVKLQKVSLERIKNVKKGINIYWKIYGKL